MIYTLTLNPSLDYVVKVEDCKEGLVNRTTSEEILFGGKGINVSAVLTNLSAENTALGFVGGFSGNELEDLMHKDGIRTDFVHIKNGSTRINIKIKSDEETEINAAGPDIRENELAELFEKLNAVQDGDYLVLAGSIPPSVSKDIYVTIAKRFANKNINLIVDAEKHLLTDVLAYKPFLVKPNHHELGAIFDKELTSKEEILSCAYKLQKMGARNILVSMAGKGGLFISEEKEALYSPAPIGKVVNSTGAGDSTIAGFLAEYLSSRDYKKSFVMGLCAGSASAFSPKLATKEEVLNLYNSFPFDKIELL